MLAIIADIATLIALALLIISKMIKIVNLYKDSRLIVRQRLENESYYFEEEFNGDEEIVIYDTKDNMYDIEFFEIKYLEEKNRFKEVKKLNKREMPKLISNQKIMVKTVIPCGIPSLKVKWKNISGMNISVIISYDGRDGYKIGELEYKHNLKSILYNLFN